MGTYSPHNLTLLRHASVYYRIHFQSTFEHVATAYQQHEFFFQVPASISEKVAAIIHLI